MLPKSSICGTLNWRQSISHDCLETLSFHEWSMHVELYRFFWKNHPFLKKGAVLQKTIFAWLWTWNMYKHAFYTIVFSPLARQGVPACLCIFVSRYNIYIYEYDISMKHISFHARPGNIFHTWSIWLGQKVHPEIWKAKWQAWKVFRIDTPPKINIEPEIDGLEDGFPLPGVSCQVPR